MEAFACAADSRAWSDDSRDVTAESSAATALRRLELPCPSATVSAAKLIRTAMAAGAVVIAAARYPGA